MDKEVSEKITFLNYILICLIVLLHCDNRTTPDFNGIKLNIGGEFLFWISNYIAIMAVPTYFALSGYLFFRNCTDTSIKRKFNGRCKTVLFPYLIWNIGFYMVYALLNYIPEISNRINFEIPQMSLEVLLFENYANPPLWFLLKLFILQIFSPLVYIFFKKLRKYNLIWLIGFLIADYIVDFGYSNVLHWVAVYFGGGFLSYFYGREIESGKPFNRIPKSIYYMILVVLLVLQNFILQWFLAPIFCWMILSLVKSVPYRNFMKSSFFIFCTHYFVILIIRKLLFMLFGTNSIAIIVIYLASFISTCCFLTFIGFLFKSKYPKVYGILCGGR